MTRYRLILAALALTLALSAPALLTFAQCAAVGQVSPLYNTVNVRGIAGNTTATPLSAISRGTSVPVSGSVQASGGVWYQLCSGGFVSGSVAIYTTNTRTPVPPVTRIPSRTPGPTATERRTVWISFAEGTLYDCPLPCTVTIYDQLPTRQP